MQTAPNDVFWYRMGEAEEGPMPLAELRERWRQGALSLAGSIRKRGSDWKAANAFLGLLEGETASIPLPQPAPTPPAGMSVANKVLIVSVISTLGVLWFGSVSDHAEAVRPAAAQRSVPGAPYQSPWDFSVPAVETYMRKSVADPDVRFSDWSKLISTAEVQPGTYGVVVTVRAKNTFGGWVAQKWAFMLDSEGNVLRAEH